MKRLFCTVVTDYEGQLDSPWIFHIKAETQEKAEVCAIEQLKENGYEDSMIEEHFELLTFPVREEDIIEA